MQSKYYSYAEFLHDIATACGLSPKTGERYVSISRVQLLVEIADIRRQRDEARARVDVLARENERLSNRIWPPRMEID